MRTRVASVFFCLAVLTASTASAQISGSDRATGENYHVEVGGYFWNPTPDIFLKIEGLGIPGSRIDFVEDLGIEKKMMTQMKVVLRPGTKHKFRFEYTPIRYDAIGHIRQNVVFAGIEFPLDLEVATDLTWRAYRFGYEWDFLYMDRGFVGLLLDVKYTDVEARLSNVIASEFARARAPIPTIGVVGRD
jgi:hypothetical protein